MTLICGNEGDPPVKVSFPLIDAAAGMIAAMAILAALRERDRTGHGMFARCVDGGGRIATDVSVDL